MFILKFTLISKEYTPLQIKKIWIIIISDLILNHVWKLIFFLTKLAWNWSVAIVLLCPFSLPTEYNHIIMSSQFSLHSHPPKGICVCFWHCVCLMNCFETTVNMHCCTFCNNCTSLRVSCRCYSGVITVLSFWLKSTILQKNGNERKAFHLWNAETHHL